MPVIAEPEAKAAESEAKAAVTMPGVAEPEAKAAVTMPDAAEHLSHDAVSVPDAAVHLPHDAVSVPDAAVHNHFIAMRQIHTKTPIFNKYPHYSPSLPTNNFPAGASYATLNLRQRGN